ncbi:HK97 family phage prohead protease, partial [Nioella sp.]
MYQFSQSGLEMKFCRFDEDLTVRDGHLIEGYASLFGACDQGGDVVQQGAYARSLKGLSDAGRSVKMLWQHDPAQPIGVWDELR